jgi:periplasmic protein TonB
MTSNEILKADVLDILFENRNKMYGAYTLRKFYNNRLLTALSFSIITVVLLLLLLKPEVSSSQTKPVIPECTVTVIELPKDLPRPLEQTTTPMPPKATAAPAAQQQYTDQIKITTAASDAIMVEQNELINAAISNVTMQGIPGEILPPVTENYSVAVLAIPQDQPAAQQIQAEPQFPGGAEAWAAFLNRYLQAPDGLDDGEKKTVMVKFLVSTDGNITGFEIVQSGGAAFDNEVIRVLKKMPKWKPAVKNGQPVAVTFTQPVTFIGIEN